MVMSAVLVVITILLLQNEKVVDAADNIVLLEKKHPGYWEYLCSNGVSVQSGDKDANVYTISKSILNQISHQDIELLEKHIRANPNMRSIINFLDGTGIVIDSGKATYGNLDINSWQLSNSIDSVEDKGDYVLLASSDGNSKTGINGILQADTSKQIDQIEDVYLYLDALKGGEYSYVISVLSDAHSHWNHELNNRLQALGLQGGFAFRDAYIAVSEHGSILHEEVSHSSINYNGTIEGYELSVRSSGFDTGSDSSILINGNEYSVRDRGLNIVVLKDTAVVDSVCFDTCSGLLTCIRK